MSISTTSSRETQQLLYNFSSFNKRVTDIKRSVEQLNSRSTSLRDIENLSKEEITGIISNQEELIQVLRNLGLTTSDIQVRSRDVLNAQKMETNLNPRENYQVQDWYRRMMHRCNDLRNNVNNLIAELEKEKEVLKRGKSNELAKAVEDTLGLGKDLNDQFVGMRQTSSQMGVPDNPQYTNLPSFQMDPMSLIIQTITMTYAVFMSAVAKHRSKRIVDSDTES